MTLSETDIDNLLTDLSGKDVEKCKKAQRFFDENNAEILPQLRESFYRKLAVHRRAWRRSSILWYILPFLILADLISLLFLFFVLFGEYAVHPRGAVEMGIIRELLASTVFLFTLTFFCSAHILYWRIRPYDRQVILLQQLGEMNDQRYIGYLIDLMEEGNPRWSSILEPLLYPQLDRLRTTQLSSVHHRYLRKQLIYYAAFEADTFDAEKSLILLKALEQVGDEQDYDTVKRVQNEGRTEAVKEAARVCLPSLKMRQYEETPYNTLLRASENTGGKEELLRAARSTGKTDANTLLRVPKEN